MVIVWAPIPAVASEADPAIATAEAIKEGASRLSAAKAAAYTEETETKEGLMAKATALKQEIRLYKATAKMLQTPENMPISVKYLGEERRLIGNQEVTEHVYLFDDKRHAVLAIKTATADAELSFINFRLSRIAEREWPCRAESSRCNSSVISETTKKNQEARESFLGALNTIRIFAP